MEDVSFGFGRIIFVEEFEANAVVGRTLRIVGRCVILQYIYIRDGKETDEIYT